MFPVAFNPVIGSLNPVTIASTSPVVHPECTGIYSTLAVGLMVSRTVTVLVVLPVLPAVST